MSSLDPDALSVDRIWSDPTVDESPVVTNLESFPVNGLDDVQILIARDLTQHDVADIESGGVYGSDGTELP
jgi:hypothetical protein